MYSAVINNWFTAKRASILDVAANWISEFRQMDANLIGSTSFQSAFQFAVLANCSKCREMGDGVLAN